MSPARWRSGTLVGALLARRPWLVAATLAMAMGYAAFRPAEAISVWVASCWLADYGQGFLKRGLPGELLGPGPWDLHQLAAIGRGILGLIVAAGAAAAAHVTARCARRTPEALFGVCCWLLLFVLAPFSLQQFGREIGRFDQITLLLVGAGIALVAMGGLAQWLAVLLAAVCPLVHEAALLLHLPVLFAFWWQHGKGHNRLPFVIALAGAAAVGWACGRAAVAPEDLDRLRTHLQARAVDFALPDGFAELYSYTTRECIALTFDRWSWRILRHFVSVMALCAPLCVLTVRGWRCLGDRGYVLSGVACLCAGAPMFILGFDFFRWLGNLWFGQWLLIACFAMRANCWDRLGRMIQGAPGWTSLAFVSCLYVGPIGVTLALDDRLLLVW